MGWIDRLFMRRDRERDERDDAKDEEAAKVLGRAAAVSREARATAEYRRLDDVRAQAIDAARHAGTKAREAGEDLIDEVEKRD